MKIAFLGGSFNPIHIGHLILADWVCKNLGYDKILFVPVFTPPHKEMADAATAQDRLEMVRAACAGDPRFEAETCEIDRGGISYTWDTACFLERKYAGQLEGKLGLIFGGDLASDFDKWNHAGELAKKCDIILAVRPERQEDERFANRAVGVYSHDEDNPFCREKLSDFPFPCRKIENPQVDISSTGIREAVAMGRGWRYLVNEGVFEYIKEHKLYGFKDY